MRQIEILTGFYRRNDFSDETKKERLFFVSGLYRFGRGKVKVAHHPLFLTDSQSWYLSSCFVNKGISLEQFRHRVRRGVPRFELIKAFDADHLGHFIPRTKVRWIKDYNNVYEVNKVFVPSESLLVSITDTKSGSVLSIEPEALVQDYDCIRQ